MICEPPRRQGPRGPLTYTGLVTQIVRTGFNPRWSSMCSRFTRIGGSFDTILRISELPRPGRNGPGKGDGLRHVLDIVTWMGGHDG